VNCDLGIIQRHRVVDYLEELSWLLPEETEENHGNVRIFGVPACPQYR
jgi:hypothetical protein